MKRSKVFEQILNSLVLLASLAIIIVASIELLEGDYVLGETFILRFHLCICGLFLTDFFVRWYTAGWTKRFFRSKPVLPARFDSLPEHRLRAVHHNFPFHVVNSPADSPCTGYLRGFTHRKLDDTQPNHESFCHLSNDSFHNHLFLQRRFLLHGARVNPP